ncbi:Benzoate 4-monooxygenase [Cyphellophora attinorum]|uniref:Benzoate 4-monooxygenase n=1 Tax=Cyphellophora attinorum TaxID=1664694 RepID=A0A0N1HKG9_9EURO|nr:Benzoate 4-monooxygenase [Phialophora attinorum]KPI34745.1 Benzoate 4-monooxygenase [Phialophora attinorum]
MAYLPIDNFYRSLGQAKSQLSSFAQASLKQRDHSDHATADVVSLLSGSKDPDTGETIDDDVILAEATGFIAAGSHSTAVTMTLFVDAVARNHNVRQRLQAELDAAFPGDLPADWVAPRGVAAALPYLMATIRESQRMFPTSSIGLERVIPEGGRTICGQRLPAGTLISSPLGCALKDPRIFDQPDQFDPERWLGADSKELMTHFHPFSLGPRVCLGRAFATYEMVKTLATFIRLFDFESASPSPPQRSEGFFPLQSRSFGASTLSGGADSQERFINGAVSTPAVDPRASTSVSDAEDLGLVGSTNTPRLNRMDHELSTSEACRDPVTSAVAVVPDTLGTKDDFSWQDLPEFHYVMDLDNNLVRGNSAMDNLNSDLEPNFFALDTAPEAALYGLYMVSTDVFDLAQPFDNPEIGNTSDLVDICMDSRLNARSADNLQPERIKHPEIVPELPRWSICKCTPVQHFTLAEDIEIEAFTPSDLLSLEGPWSDSIEEWRTQTFQKYERIVQVDLTEETREWMLVVLQDLLRLSQDLCGTDLDTDMFVPALIPKKRPTARRAKTFMLLPPSQSLRRYLEIYLTTFEPFTPSIPALSLNPNKLATSSNERGATTLLLLMVALGAMLDPALKARSFSTVLLGICQHAILDGIGRESGAVRRSLVLHCALVYISGAAFSGSRLHMDLSTCQRPMFIGASYYFLYHDSRALPFAPSARHHADFFTNTASLVHTDRLLQMIKQADFFSPTPLANSVAQDCHNKFDTVWERWIDRENVSRLAYLWVIADLEISLFYETPLSMSVTDLQASLPSSEHLWLAPSAAAWRACFTTSATGDAEAVAQYLQKPRLGLDQLFSLFLQDLIDVKENDLQPLHLRLLLYPIHGLVSQARQALRLVPRDSHATFSSIAHSLAAQAARVTEVQSILHRWYRLYCEVHPRGVREQAVKDAALITYHLISLNVYVSFSDLEGFIRESTVEPRATSVLQRGWIQDAEHAVFHCGQILRLVRCGDVKLRPVWWSAAVYRVTIVLHSLSIGKMFKEVNSQPAMNQANNQVDVVLDKLEPDDPILQQFLCTKTGIPCVTSTNGLLVPLCEDPHSVQQACTDTLDGGSRTSRLTEGIRVKLEATSRRWHGPR